MNSSADEATALREWTKMCQGTFWEHLGCEPVEYNQHEVAAKLEIQPHHLNVMQVVHGGVLSSALDSVMGTLAMARRPGLPVVTANLNLHFTASAKSGTLQIVAHVVHEAKNTLTIEGRVYDDANQLCAYATGSFRVVGGSK